MLAYGYPFDSSSLSLSLYVEKIREESFILILHIFAAYNPMAVVSSCFIPCMSHMVAACTSWGFNCPEGPFTHLRFHHHQQFHNVHNAQWQGFGLALASWQVLDLKDRKLHTLRIEILRNPFEILLESHGISWDPAKIPKQSDDIWNPHEIPMKSPGNRNLKVMRLRALESLLEALQAGTPSASLSRRADSVLSWLLFL